MDHVRVKSKFHYVRKLWLPTLGAIILAGLIATLTSLDFGTRRIERDSLLIGTVERGDLDIKISANGTLLPRDVEWLAAHVEGRVAVIKVRPGDEIKQGQVLVELNNPSIINAAEEVESALNGGRAELISFAVELENRLLNQKSIAMRAKFDYEGTRIQLQAESILHRDKIISNIQFRRTQLRTQQLLETWKIEKEKYQKSQDNMKTQLATKESKVKQLEKALERANRRVQDLTIRAGIDGVVQELALKTGQGLQAGSEVARLVGLGELYAELKIPARQASDIQKQQHVVIDTRNGLVEGHVSRIDPAVTEGTVIIDVDLDGPLPRGARPQLSVEGFVYIAQLRDVLFVGKPAFSKVDGDITLYRLDEDQQYAQRTVVRLGQASVSNVQIIEGLKVGDKVILSDSGSWQDHARIFIN